LSDAQNGGKDKPDDNKGFAYVLSGLVFIAAAIGRSITSKNTPEENQESANAEIVPNTLPAR
jgi:hypothetical protein